MFNADNNVIGISTCKNNSSVIKATIRGNLINGLITGEKTGLKLLEKN